MTEPANPPYPQQRTPEQHAAVRRRALPIALAAAILGVVGLVWMLQAQITAFAPPNPYGVNFSFCAMLFGVGILFYARGTSGTRPAAVLCIIAVLASLAGPYLFSRQLVEYHRLAEDRERGNVRAIAAAAITFAAGHDGAFPADLLVLLEEKQLNPDALRSPLAFKRDTGAQYQVLDNLDALRPKMPRDALLTALTKDADYQYLAGDVKLPPAFPAAKDILVASSTNTVMRVNLAVAFADGRATFITTEEVGPTMTACNAAREKLALPALRPPPIIENAMTQNGAEPGPRSR